MRRRREAANVQPDLRDDHIGDSASGTQDLIETFPRQVGSNRSGTSGSGDVLAGAAAGDGLAVTHARVGFLARELLDELPTALSTLTP